MALPWRYDHGFNFQLKCTVLVRFYIVKNMQYKLVIKGCIQSGGLDYWSDLFGPKQDMKWCSRAKCAYSLTPFGPTYQPLHSREYALECSMLNLGQFCLLFFSIPRVSYRIYRQRWEVIACGSILKLEGRSHPRKF